jgi:sulfofructose kinase
MTRILCLGMSALDAIYRVPRIPSTGTKVLATAYTECGGGMAANASVAVARLGGEAHYWGRVGNDPLGERIVAELAAQGVITTRVRRIEGCISPSAAILVADDGERLVCAYNDPALDADPSWLPEASVGSFDAVLADVRWPAGAGVVLGLARAAGIPAILDADVGPIADILSLARQATHIAFSQAGLGLVTGIGTPGAALRALASELRGVLGVTLGADGFLYLDRDREHRVPAPEVQAIDTLGAGDVWHGAFALALGERQPLDTAARFANVAAAIKCTRFGGRRGAPSRAEVEDWLARTDAA